MKERKTEDTTKFAQDLPKFSEVVKRKRGRIKNFNGEWVNINWDWNDWAHQHQMFRLEVENKCSHCKGRCDVDIIISRQALEHFVRAV